MAAHLRSRSICRPYVFFVLILATFSPVSSAQICSFWDTGCVDPLAQTAVAFRFPPLFLEEINLYYAFDADARGKGQGPMTKASFWIGYEAYINNSVIDTNRTSEIGMRIGNLTGTPSGANNGCDGVWGSECSKNLKILFKQAIYDLSTKGEPYANPLSTVLGQFQVHLPLLMNCPPPFFDVQDILVDQFAQEIDTDQTAVIKTTGTSDSPWKTWFIDSMTASQQAEQVAVAVISRAPSYNSIPPQSLDDIEIELICIQAPSAGGGSSSEDGS